MTLRVADRSTMRMPSAIFALAVCLVGCAAPPAISNATTASPTSISTPAPTRSDEPAPTGSDEPATQPSLPEPTLWGTFPGPNETIPPGQPVIAGLTLDELAAVWSSLRLSCVATPVGLSPESAAAYGVYCEGRDPSSDLDVVAEAGYWTVDGIAIMQVILVPNSSPIDAGTAAEDWVVPFAELAGGDVAVAWVRNHVGDASCFQGCTIPIRGADLSYYSGVGAAQELFFVAPVPVVSP